MKASHILVSTVEQATHLKEQIDAGANFAALAGVSMCPSGQNGGDLGEFGPGQMVKAFEDAVISLPLNGVSGPVQTQFGFHLIHRTG